MSRPRSARQIAAWLLALGATSLLLKLLVILVTDGEVIDSGLASVFLLAGVAFLVAGFGAFGFWSASRWPLVVRIAAAVVGVVAFFVAFDLLDRVGKGFADEGSYWRDEIGILLTAILAALLAAFTALRGERDA